MTENLYKEQMQIFDENYQFVKEKMANAAVKSGRQPEEITLLAATKTVPVDVINHAVQAGIGFIGENRVQELMDKYELLDASCKKHHIGQLQQNKIKYLIGKVSCIQSVDSMKTVQEIDRLCCKQNLVMPILIEVNIGKEQNKGGIMPEELFAFIDEAREYSAVHINGLMAIPPICEELSRLSSFFGRMNEYYVDIRNKKLDNVTMQCLSMGMSADYELAIENGATMVRLGSILFGKRS